MPSPTASSALARWLEKLRDLVAASETFQDRLEVDTAAETHDHIFYDLAIVFDDTVTEEQLRAMRPFVIVTEMDTLWQKIGVGNGPDMAFSGELVIWIEANAEYADNHNDSKIDFCNFAGGIVDDLAALTGQTGYEDAPQIRQLQATQRTDVKDRETDDFWWVCYAVKVGLEAE